MGLDAVYFKNSIDLCQILNKKSE